MDEFTDNIITINIDDPNWVERAKTAGLLVIHTIFRPLQSSEQLKRDNPISLRKIEGEGQLAKQKTYMGWDIQTLYIRIFLPKERYIS